MRAVDKALLVNGTTCTDTAPALTGAALTTKLKSIAFAAAADLSHTAETVIFDIRNGTFALASGSGGGISLDLAGGNDVIGVLGSTSADTLGCTVALGGDAIGLKSATSADVKVTTRTGTTFTIDLNDGNDSFNQGNCTTQMTIYGGAGNDTFTATAEPTLSTTLQADTFVGGAGSDTLSYVNRTNAVQVAPGTNTNGESVSGTLGDEGDNVTEVETIIGGSGADVLIGGTETAVTQYTLSGGPGNDTFSSVKSHGVTFAGGTGIDLVDYSGRTPSGATGVTVTMGDGQANDGEAGDTDNVGSDVENLFGTTANDTITGNTLNNIITPFDGNDTVNGGDGDDTFVAGILTAGAAADGADGNDVFNGGTGNDTVNYSAITSNGVCVFLDGSQSGQCTVDSTVHGGPASCSPALACAADTRITARIATESDVIGKAGDVENIIGTGNADYLVGTAVANVIMGSSAASGKDVMFGMAGDDQIDDNAYVGGGTPCNPNTNNTAAIPGATPLLACSGTVTDSCAAPVITCGTSATLETDPLDIVSCTTAAHGTAYTNGTCAVIQTN